MTAEAFKSIVPLPASPNPCVYYFQSQHGNTGQMGSLSSSKVFSGLPLSVEQGLTSSAWRSWPSTIRGESPLPPPALTISLQRLRLSSQDSFSLPCAFSHNVPSASNAPLHHHHSSPPIEIRVIFLCPPQMLLPP